MAREIDGLNISSTAIVSIVAVGRADIATEAIEASSRAPPHISCQQCRARVRAVADVRAEDELPTTLDSIGPRA